ncbi:MAG: Holliday junction branch migration protein RuvA [Candidatus Nanopelagicales bacterium]
MIASLRGPVTYVGRESAVVEVGGIGLSVLCTATDLRQLHRGNDATLFTTLVVREDSLTLFGFLDADGRDTFDVLMSVSGVGPRLALAVLSALTVEQLKAAIHASDEAVLVQVPGIGRKGAQRMALELADKLGAPTSAHVDVRDSVTTPGDGARWRVSVREALISLGWSARESDEVVVLIAPQQAEHEGLDDAALVSKMLALALRGLDSR